MFRIDEELVLYGSDVLFIEEGGSVGYPSIFPTTDWEIRSVGLYENPFADTTVVMREELRGTVGFMMRVMR